MPFRFGVIHFSMFLLAVTGELWDNVLFAAPVAEPKMVVVGLRV